MEGVATDGPSFPPRRRGGAASTVLTYLFPDAEAGRFETLAEEAATPACGPQQLPSDIEAYWLLGRLWGTGVGSRQGRRLRCHLGRQWPVDGRGLLGTDPTQVRREPVEPLAGTWQTWVLPSGDTVRPAPPPEYGSPLWQAELEAVQEATSEPHAGASADRRVLGQQGSIPILHRVRSRIDRAQWSRRCAYGACPSTDERGPGRCGDCRLGCKYTWWTSRPITEDPDLDMLLPTPAYPSYPSGFSAVAGSGAVVLSHLFPRAEVDLMRGRGGRATVLVRHPLPAG